jgi:ComF family protein
MDYRAVLQEITELVFPPRCAVCEQWGAEVFCAACRAQVEYLRPPYCSRCGRPQMPTADAHMLCGECRGQPPALSGARAVGLHTGTLRRAVLRMKFDRRRGLIEPLGRLLAARLAAEAEQPEPLDLAPARALLPVALHPRRRAWRGFDQAVLLSRALSRHAGLECWEDILRRVKNTHQQVGLSVEERRANLAGAFQVTDRRRIAGGSFLLLDDVYTTGSTLQEAAKAVLRTGARAVYGLTITRAAPNWHLGKIVTLGDEEDRAEG